MAPNPVPRHHQVVTGVHVSLVLKADQPTGRQVRGIVQQVLTRGDHHRGIKVRLTDGRVGRVQSIVSATVDSSATQSSSNNATSMNGPTPYTTEDTSEPRGQGRRPRYRDARLEEEQLGRATEQMDLSVYIVPSKQRKAKAKRDTNISQEVETCSPGVSQAMGDLISAIATCPVCGNFEGDETAVAHHVAEHFEA
ncbi:hypothetical protein GGR50DRAFT_405279 [Xylaria sp. CBS 124048]|nr:hypothetical protein GGR50DRAFT_405279 [Xylaria sp. CBS 124048]